MKTEWIKCSERLPDSVGWYKIMTEHGEFEAPYCSSLGMGLVWLTPFTATITHWMPLPEPPKTKTP